MNNEFYNLNDLTLLYFQDIEYLINILNVNGIKFKDYENDLRYNEIMETFNKCYKRCVELGYYEKESEK